MEKTTETWLTALITESTAIRDLYYKAKRIQGIHTSLGLDTDLATIGPPHTKPDVDAVLTTLGAFVTFIETGTRLAELERVSRTV